VYAGILKALNLIESIVATAAYAAVAGLLMADVIGRELFSQSFLGAQQLAVYGAIMAGFIGLTLATSDSSHLRPGFMDFIFKTHEQNAIRIGDGISAGFYGFAAYVAWTFVAYSMEAGDRAPVLYFVVWPLQIIIPYALVSAGTKHLIFALRPELKHRSTIQGT
jgi:TRAP-type C4-dicarboxylate transport system permease small subunit